MPTGEQSSTAPRSLDKSVTSAGVVGTVTGLEAVSAKAQLPGEVAGPALLVHLRLQNESSTAIDLDTVVVNLYDSADDPAGEMTAKPNHPVRGTLAAGRAATGAYLFTIDPDRRARVTVNVILPTEGPVMVFQGKAPR